MDLQLGHHWGWSWDFDLEQWKEFHLEILRELSWGILWGGCWGWNWDCCWDQKKAHCLVWLWLDYSWGQNLVWHLD